MNKPTKITLPEGEQDESASLIERAIGRVDFGKMELPPVPTGLAPRRPVARKAKPVAATEPVETKAAADPQPVAEPAPEPAAPARTAKPAK